MKLIKLVYLAHGWSLGFREKPLIADAVEAWQYGPVIGALYREFKRFGNTPISALAQISTAEAREDIDRETKELLDKVWNNYSSLSAAQLSSLTHEKGSPWSKVWHDLRGKNEMGAIISEEMIRSFYGDKVDAARR